MEGVSNNSYIDSMKWKKDEGAKYADPDEQQKLEQEDFFKLLTQQLNMQDDQLHHGGRYYRNV